jgi:hypothetical protein
MEYTIGLQYTGKVHENALVSVAAGAEPSDSCAHCRIQISYYTHDYSVKEGRFIHE